MTFLRSAGLALALISFSTIAHAGPLTPLGVKRIVTHALRSQPGAVGSVRRWDHAFAKTQHRNVYAFTATARAAPAIKVRGMIDAGSARVAGTGDARVVITSKR
jgi:hypothetical protein